MKMPCGVYRKLWGADVKIISQVGALVQLVMSAVEEEKRVT